MLSIPFESVEDRVVGDLLVFEEKKYRLIKKTHSAVAVERYYWFTPLLDRLFGRHDSGPDNNRLRGA